MYAVLVSLHGLLSFLQPLLIPICCIFAWGFLWILARTLWTAATETAVRAKEMHQIPCPNCQFFTNNHRLKCTVQPTIAHTEQAIDCSDYCPKSYVI
jgi:hypothetical protein